ncbi:MAG: DUF5723 family protein, partial [Bacteroidales bacterium]|nr:DUF5723 family protein [Bacteroidales bacterium]
MNKFNQISSGRLLYSFLVVVIVLLLLVPVKMFSQVSRSVYFLEHLPESSIQNPAFNPPYNFYVNLPVVSTLYIGFESPFSYNDLTEKWETGDSLYIDRESVLNALKEVNYFSFEIYDELGRAGFRA